MNRCLLFGTPAARLRQTRYCRVALTLSARPWIRSGFRHGSGAAPREEQRHSLDAATAHATAIAPAGQKHEAVHQSAATNDTEFLLEGYEAQPQARAARVSRQQMRKPLAARHHAGGITLIKRYRFLPKTIGKSSRPGLGGNMRMIAPKSPAPAERESRPKPFHLVWRNLQRTNDGDNTKSKSSGAHSVLDPHASAWVEAAFDQLRQGSENIDLEALPFTNGTAREAVWMNCALWLLHNDKGRVADFLMATHAEPYPPEEWVSYSLQLLATHFSRQEGPEAGFECRKLANAFFTVAQRPPGDPLVFPSAFASRLIPHLDPEQVHRLYRTITTEHVKVRWDTLVYLSKCFAKSDRMHEAIDALLEAHRIGADFRDRVVQETCMVVLRRAVNQPGGFRECLRLCDNLTALGLRLTTGLANVLVLNAIDAGDVKTGYDIYRTLFVDSVTPDSFTFAILLKGYKSAPDDSDPLTDTVRNAIERVSVSQSPVLGNEILHCLIMHHTRHAPEHAWDTICQWYTRFFDAEPLVQLNLPVARSAAPDDRSGLPKPIHLPSIGLMLGAYVELKRLGNAACHVPPYQIFKRFRDLVEAGTHPFLGLASTDHCYNIFLWSLIQNRSGMIHAAVVIKDMQRPLPDSSPVQKCSPTVQSWNIFLLGFSKHGLVRLAEQVLSYMRSKGIEPNQVTWEKLTAAYAGQQDLTGLLTALRRADQSGAVWSGFLERGLRRYKNQRQLRRTLHKSRKTLALDFSDEIKEGLAARLETAASVAREDGSPLIPSPSDEIEVSKPNK